MKRTLNAFWIISAVFLCIAALWGVISGLANVMSSDTICGIAMVIFGVISVLAFFTTGAKATGSGWLLFDGISSFFCGLAFIFRYVDYALFAVDLVYIMGLWLMFLGISQIARAERTSRSFSRVAMTVTGVLSVLTGLSVYIKPVADLLYATSGGRVLFSGLTAQLIVAALLVICRCFSKEHSRR